MEILEDILGDPTVWIYVIYKMKTGEYPEEDIPPFFFYFMLPFYITVSVGRPAVLGQIAIFFYFYLYFFIGEKSPKVLINHKYYTF